VQHSAAQLFDVLVHLTQAFRVRLDRLDALLAER
jgi:hypothetical protein